MERKVWDNHHPVESEVEEEEEETESVEDESDEEEEKQKFVRRENVNKSGAGRTMHPQQEDGTSEDDGEDAVEEEDDEETEEEEEEEEESSEGAVGNSIPPPQGQRKQIISNVEESGSGSDSDIGVSLDDEIGKIPASDWKSSVDTIGKKPSSTLQKSLKAGAGQDDTTVKNAKRLRDDAQELEETPSKRKKEGGSKIHPSAKVGKAHHDISKETLHGQKPDKLETENSMQRPKPSEKEGSVGKKARKQKGQAQDDSQTHVAERNGESERKEQKREKTDSVPEKSEKEDRDQELGTDKKTRKQKEQVPTISQQGKELLSPQKQKKPANWTPNDETALASGAMHRVKAGLDLLPRKGDDFWVNLTEELEGHWTKEQLYDKLRRMKTRYQAMADRMKADDSKPFPFRNAHEESLYKLWKQTWGRKDGEGEEVEETQKVKEPARIKSEASGIRRKEEGKKEPGTPRVKQDEPIAADADGTDNEKEEEPREGGANLMELDQKRLGLTSLAMAIESSLLSNQDSQVGKLLQRGSVDPSTNDIHKLLPIWTKSLLEEFQSSCNHVFEGVQAKIMLTIQSALRTALRSQNGTNFLLPSSFGMPFLAGADCLDMKLVDANDVAHDKLRQQWYGQLLQEVNVFSQRLHLMQEQYRIQKEHIEMLLSCGKG